MQDDHKTKDQLIEELQELQERLAKAKQSERILEALVEYIPEGITIADAPDVRIRMISRHGRELTGQTRETIEGIPVEEHAQAWNLFYADGVTPAKNKDLPLTRAVQKGEVTLDEEWALRRPDGTKIQLLCNAGPIRDENGSITGGVIAWRDITERKRMEETLRAAEENMRLAFNQAPIGVAIVGLDYRLKRVNAEMCRILGYPDHELLALTFPELTHPEDLIEDAVNRDYLLTGEIDSFRLEKRYIRKDGVIVWGRLSVRLVRNLKGEPLHFLSMLEDITERRRMEEELRRSRDELELRVRERTKQLAARNAQLYAYAARLELLNNELQEFSFVASHDLQEPLRKILAFATRLRTKSDVSLGEEGGDFLSRMENAAMRMSALLSALLGYSRVTTQATPFAPISLHKVAEEVVSDLEVRIEESGAQVSIEALPMLEADESQMRQLLQNLIANALKYRREDEPPLIQVHARVEDDICKLFVEDNGIGFEEKYLDRIFKPFQRLHGKGAYEGTGMGLAICRKIVERHRGTITARSTPGKGSIFMVKLPVKQLELEPTVVENT